MKMKKITFIMIVMSAVLAACNNQNKLEQSQKTEGMNTEVPQISDFSVGEENTAYAQYFSGKSWLSPLTKMSELNVPISNVTFEPACRNNWHSHTGGQILIAVGGVGFYQERGKEAQQMLPGDVIEIAPDIEHWHGAAPDSWFSHLAIACNPQTNENIWLAPVTDEQYKDAVNQLNVRNMENSLNRKQQKIVTIAANTAIGNLNALQTELNAGLDAGLTVNQIKEILVQMYAYAGFPRSLQGINTFMSVLDDRKSRGINDAQGAEASPITDTRDKYTRGREVLEKLTLIDQKNITGANAFAPAIDVYLKEHLFADIFERDVLTYLERELATISALAVMTGVDPMLQSHINMGMNVGWTEPQLRQVASIIASSINKQQGDNTLQMLNKVITGR